MMRRKTIDTIPVLTEESAKILKSLSKSRSEPASLVTVSDLKPHKIRYWLHSPEKQDNPETFCEKVNEICDLYLNAQTLSQNGTYVILKNKQTREDFLHDNHHRIRFV